MDAKRRKCAGFLKKGEDWLIPGFCCLILFLAAGLAWDYYYDLNDDAWLCARPSGTEPKLKFYAAASAKDAESAESRAAEYLAFMKRFAE